MSLERFPSANGSCNRNAGGMAGATVEEAAISNMPPDGPKVVRAMMTYTRKGSKVGGGTTIPPGNNTFTAAGGEINPNGTRVFGPATRGLGKRYHGSSFHKHYE